MSATLAERVRTPAYATSHVDLDAIKDLPLDQKMQILQENMDKNRASFQRHWSKARAEKEKIVVSEVKHRLESLVG